MDFFQYPGPANILPGRYEQLVDMFPDYDIDLILTSFPTQTVEIVANWILSNTENAPKKRRPPKRKTEERSSTDEEEYFSDEDEIVEGLVLQKLLKELYSKYIVSDLSNVLLSHDVKTFLGQCFPSVRLDFIARAFTHNKNICSTMIACWFVANKCTTKLRELMNNPEHIMWITTDTIQSMRKKRFDILENDIPQFNIPKNRNDVIKFKEIMVNLSNKYPRILNGTKLTKEAFTLMIEIPEGVEMFECGVCFVQKTIDKRIQCGNNESEIQHSFCRTCLRGHATAASEDMPLAEGAIGFKCMEFKCQNAIIYGKIRSLIPKNIRKKIDERILEENLGQSGLNLERCRDCNYAMEMVETKEENKVFECQNCEKNWCRLCHREWNEEHFGLTCEEVDERNNINRRQRDLEAKLNEVVIRRCNRCGIQYMKQEGCNKMTCRCGATQCYVCKKTDITYDHFCRHPRAPGINKCDQCPGNACTLWQDAKSTDDEQIERIQREEGILLNRPKTPEYERKRNDAKNRREEFLNNGFFHLQADGLFQPLRNYNRNDQQLPPNLPLLQPNRLIPPPILPAINRRPLTNYDRPQQRPLPIGPPPPPPQPPVVQRLQMMPQPLQPQLDLPNYNGTNGRLFDPFVNPPNPPMYGQRNFYQDYGLPRDLPPPPLLQQQQRGYMTPEPIINYPEPINPLTRNLNDIGRFYTRRMERQPQIQQPPQPTRRYGQLKRSRTFNDRPLNTIFHHDDDNNDWRRRPDDDLFQIQRNFDDIEHLRNYQQQQHNDDDRLDRLVDDVAAGNFNNNQRNDGPQIMADIILDDMIRDLQRQQEQRQREEIEHEQDYIEWNLGEINERNEEVQVQIQEEEENDNRTENLDDSDDDDDLEILGQNFQLPPPQQQLIQQQQRIIPKRTPLQIAIDRLNDGAPTYEFIPLGIENYHNAFKDLINDVNVITEFIINDVTTATKTFKNTFETNYPELKNGQENELFQEFIIAQKEMEKAAKNQKEINEKILKKFEENIKKEKDGEKLTKKECDKKLEIKPEEILEPKPGPSGINHGQRNLSNNSFPNLLSITELNNVKK